jgi:CheY-like chemotaxis protein
LISDIGMPEKDGFELIRMLRARELLRGSAKVPAMALTAFARAEDRTRAIMSGYQVHLSKPVEPAELTVNVASLAGKTS